MILAKQQNPRDSAPLILNHYAVHEVTETSQTSQAKTSS